MACIAFLDWGLLLRAVKIFQDYQFQDNFIVLRNGWLHSNKNFLYA